MKSEALKYLLITPAKNEETFVELTIQSVLKQTVRPVRWLIVSDGSTDRTDQIVRDYASRYDWIELFQMPERGTRDFGGKVLCVNTGYARIENLPHDIVASLDADISLQPDHFEYLLGKFREDPQLGLAGVPFAEAGVTYDYRFSSADHVSGACQVFRRECFNEIGRYTQVKSGIDVVAVLSARMKGWRTRTFTERHCEHHRPMGVAIHRNKLAANFKLGQTQYCLGFHPVWQIFRSVYQITRRPYIIAGTALCLGYFWAMAKRVKRPISTELVAFQRRDQMRRLRGFLHLRSITSAKANSSLTVPSAAEAATAVPKGAKPNAQAASK